MKKVTVIIMLLIFLIFACKKNVTPSDPIDLTEAFEGVYQFSDTCKVDKWFGAIVIEVDSSTIGQGNTFEEIDGIDTLIVTSLYYAAGIGKYGTRKVEISNFQNTGLDVHAEVGGNGKIEFIDHNLPIFRLSGIGQLIDNELVINFQKENIDGIIQDCQIIGIKQ